MIESAGLRQQLVMQDGMKGGNALVEARVARAVVRTEEQV